MLFSSWFITMFILTFISSHGLNQDYRISKLNEALPHRKRKKSVVPLGYPKVQFLVLYCF